MTERTAAHNRRLIMKQLPFIFLFTIFIASCSKSEHDEILYNKDFDSGNWLLVNVNYAENTLKMIDEEAILRNNISGLTILQKGECGGTTCDGFLMLYKDGKLIDRKEYLNNDALIESTGIKKAYKFGEEVFIKPNGEKEFQRKWDSLTRKNNYPTISRPQPKNIDIIWNYRETPANTR